MTREPVSSNSLRSPGWRAYFEGSQLFREALETSLKEACGLSLADYNILLILWETRDPMPMAALSRALVFLPSRLTYAVRSLKERGLVTQEPSSADRRSLVVSLTDVGADAFEAARKVHAQDIRELFLDHLGPEDTAVLERVFFELKDRLTE